MTFTPDLDRDLDARDLEKFLEGIDDCHTCGGNDDCICSDTQKDN